MNKQPNMATKMKGLFKGLRYISQIFDDQRHNKEMQEMQIGDPTDVKHVGHIGWEGPSALDSPSWMKEFNSTNTAHSAPLTMTGEPIENDHVKWVSQDSHRIPRGRIISPNRLKSPRGRISPNRLKSPSKTKHNSSKEVSSTEESDDYDLEYSRKNRNSKKNTAKDSASQRSRSARLPNNPGSSLSTNQDDFKKTRSTRQPKERVPGSDNSVDPEGSRKTRSTRQPKDQNSGSEDVEGLVKTRKKPKESGSDNSVDPEGSRRTRSTRQPKDQNSGSEDPEGSVRTRRKSKETGSDSTPMDPESSVKTRKKSKETGSDYSTDPEGSRRTRSTRQQPKDQNSEGESPPVDPEGSVRTRKKSKESVNGSGGSVRLKSKVTAPLPPVDLGPDSEPGNMGGSDNREENEKMNMS